MAESENNTHCALEKFYEQTNGPDKKAQLFNKDVGIIELICAKHMATSMTAMAQIFSRNNIH